MARKCLDYSWRFNIDTSGSNANQSGITVDSSNVVDLGIGSSIAMTAGGYMLDRGFLSAGNELVSMADNVISIRSSAKIFNKLFMESSGGIRMKDFSGKIWRVTVPIFSSLIVISV